MKFSLRVPVVLLLCGVFFGQAKGQQGQQIPGMGDYLKFYTEEEGVVYTDWVDNAKSHMYWKEMTALGMIPVRNEGRLRGGVSEYRKGFRNPEKAVTTMPRIRWYCYTGKSQKSFDSISDNLFLRGFFLISVQSFQDADGEQRYQSLWVKPDGALKKATELKQLIEWEKMEQLHEELRKRHSPPGRKGMEGIDVPVEDQVDKPEKLEKG
ncbi:hypothetical protein [Luteolibacter sp. AS25]|uniref:hypothetical protein n=1 Tax=Luteolibacter sp. AS25 TaxID=3135776 RepID=UPI00398AB9EF